MDTVQLECFVQVANNLNFRRAAEELHLSQPTVSKQISALEHEMGGTLFARSTRSVALTPLGAAFLPDAEEILRLTYSSAEHARRMAQGDQLVIGYSDPTELAHVANVMSNLHRAHRSLGVSLRQAPRDVNVEQLARQRVDLVLGYESDALLVGGIVFNTLRDDTLMCVTRRDTRFAKRESVSAKDLIGLPQVICLPAGLKRRGYAAEGAIPPTDASRTTHCQTTSEALCLVEAGLGYTLLPSVQCPPRRSLAYLPYTDAPHARYGVYLREGTLEAPVAQFLKLAQAEYA